MARHVVVRDDGARIVRFKGALKFLKFRIADTIYAGATGQRAACFQCAVRDSNSRDVLTKSFTA